MNKKELHKIAPILSNLQTKHSSFKTPEGYFDTVEDAVFADLKMSKIQKLETTKQFNTPSNYFETVEDVIMSKLKAEIIQGKIESELPENYFSNVEDKVFERINHKPKVISFRYKFIKYAAPMAIAASLLLIFILNNNSTDITFESLSIIEIENWINDGGMDIETVNIASIYSEMDITDEVFSSETSVDEVFEYLNEEDLDEFIFED